MPGNHAIFPPSRRLSVSRIRTIPRIPLSRPCFSSNRGRSIYPPAIMQIQALDTFWNPHPPILSRTSEAFATSSSPVLILIPTVHSPNGNRFIMRSISLLLTYTTNHDNKIPLLPPPYPSNTSGRVALTSACFRIQTLASNYIWYAAFSKSRCTDDQHALPRRISTQMVNWRHRNRSPRHHPFVSTGLFSHPLSSHQSSSRVGAVPIEPGRNFLHSFLPCSV